MVAKSFEVGDLVWAKMKGFPPWPGKIAAPPSGTKVKKSHHYVFFYGTDNYAWIADENITLHNERLVEKYTRVQKRPDRFKSAVEIIVNASKGSSKYQKNSENSFDSLSGKEGTTPKSTPKSHHSNSVTKKREIKKVPVKRNFVKRDSRKRAVDSDNSSENSIIFEETTPSKFQRVDESFSDLLANIPPNYTYSHEARIASGDREATQPSSRLPINTYVDRPPTPNLDLNLENEMLKNKKIDPSSKKFGFLGLGKLGQGIVKNLIQSGHSVTLWNRSIEKCEEFYKIGAQQLETPADVVSNCDITFCCVSDPDAAKALVFGNCGVLKGLEEPSNAGNKGYVEMTSLDPKTSRAIADEVNLKGGRYLEAPLNGSRVQAIDGTLFVLGAGDETLFDECKTCFHAMGENALFIGSEVGNASKYNIIHSMLLGTVYAAVAESLALIERVDLNQTDFLKILKYGVLNSSVIIEKGQAMISNAYTSNTPLKHMQKDLNLGLMLGSSVEQPMPITAAANEVYKHCKLLRYADHDVSAVYEGTKR